MLNATVGLTLIAGFMINIAPALIWTQPAQAGNEAALAACLEQAKNVVQKNRCYQRYQ